MLDPAHKGREFPPFSYHVERGKLREFLLAIGEDAAEAEGESALIPPTFPTVFAFWGGLNLEQALGELGIALWQVLHAEQEYEYLGPIRAGDTVTGHLQIADVYARAGMDFLELRLEYVNQRGEAVLRERSLLIVRGEGSV